MFCARLRLKPRPTSRPDRASAPGLVSLVETAKTANRLRSLGLEGQRDLVELFTCSAGEFLDQWFESDPIKAILGFDGIVGTYASPYSAGTGYVLLHHCWGEVNGKRGVWGHAIGGMGAITQAMARACAARGVEIRAGSRGHRDSDREGPRRRRRNGQGRNDRRPRRGLEPPSEAHLREASRSSRAARRFPRPHRCLSQRLGLLPHEPRAFRAAELLRPARPRPAEHHGAEIVIAPSLAYMERAFFDARLSGWSAKPIVEMLIPSTLDDSLAPPGRHVASLFCQHVAPELPDGRSWDEARETVADLMIDTVEILRARLQGLDHRPPDSLAPRPRARLRPCRRRHLSWPPEPRPALFGPSRTRARRLPLAHSGLIHVRRLDPPRRRRHRRPGHNAAREMIRDFRRRLQ